jgi:hypothetical protein
MTKERQKKSTKTGSNSGQQIFSNFIPILKVKIRTKKKKKITLNAMNVFNKNKRKVKITASIEKKMRSTIKYSKIEEEKENLVGILKASLKINSIKIGMVRERIQTKGIIKNLIKSEIERTRKIKS